MADRSYLSWPFFTGAHKAHAEALDAWAARTLAHVDHSDTDMACRALVAKLGAGDWLLTAAVDPADSTAKLDVRTLCLTRETLARHDALADFAFAMQGLGSGALSLFGTPSQKQEWLPLIRTGRAISAFALTEPRSGSDVANITLSARRDGDTYVLDGEKTWISNGGIADVYTVFARTGEGPGAKASPPSSCRRRRPASRLRNAWKRGTASSRAPALCGPARAGLGHDRPTRGRLPHRHVGARCLPLNRCRCRSRHGAPRP